MDAFYAWIEQRDHPEAREKPVGSADRANVVSPRLQLRSAAVRLTCRDDVFRCRRQLLPKAVVEGGAIVPVEIAPDGGRPDGGPPAARTPVRPTSPSSRGTWSPPAAASGTQAGGRVA